MQILTGKLFKEMVLCGANTLHNNHPEIDALNVFPVPDGDTGTNMSMTFNAGAAEIKDMDSDNIYDIAKKLSLSIETVKTQKKRAMKTLRNNLKEKLQKKYPDTSFFILFLYLDLYL